MDDLKKKLTDDIAALEREMHVDLPREIGRARALGDLSENAEYHAAKERDRKSTRLNSSHVVTSRMPSSA